MLRCAWAILIPLAASLLTAQPQPPLGILRAELIAWDGSWDGGALRLKLDSGIDYACAFDGRTFFERDRVRISIGRLRPGDSLEVVSDRVTPSARCFARMVKVLTTPVVVPTWGSITRATEHFAPRGNITIVGVIVELDGANMIVKTRQGERQTIRLRHDTRFVLNGAPATKEMVALNLAVFVRAGVGSDEEIEAYQVVTGEILQPRAAPTRQP
jgi:hypothetical protein